MNSQRFLTSEGLSGKILKNLSVLGASAVKNNRKDTGKYSRLPGLGIDHRFHGYTQKEEAFSICENLRDLWLEKLTAKTPRTQKGEPSL